MRLCLAVFLCLLGFGNARGSDWPGFRGATGMGVVEGEVALEWGGVGGKNVLWKTKLGGENKVADWNQSSPIVVGGRVFLTSAFWAAGVEGDEDKVKVQPVHRVSCFDAGDGRLLWDTEVEAGDWLLGDLRGGYASPTPVSDGERVYAMFGSSVIVAVDFDGRVVWRQAIGDHLANDVAMASSPVVFEDTVIVQADKQEGLSEIIAYDCKTGVVHWQKKRPGMNFSHASPVLMELGGKARLLVSASEGLQGVDPRNGEVVWRCGWGRSIWPVSSPVSDGEYVYCVSGRGGRPGVVVRAGGVGDVTESHLAWRVEKTSEGMSSPVIVRGSDGKNRVIRVFKPGVITCRDLATGREIYKERFEEVDPAVSPFVTMKGLVYFASAGKTVVIDGRTDALKIVKVNVIGDGEDGGLASAAVAGGRIYLRGVNSLYCVGKK